MAEFEGQPRAVEEIKQEFRSHLQSVEFGSPDYMAFRDFYALEDEIYHRTREMEKLRDNLSPEEKLKGESDLRITETKIALIEYGIARAKVTNIDYCEAFDRVEETMGELYSAIVDQMKEDFNEPGDEKWLQRVSGEDFHDILMDDFMDVLNRFYE